MSDAQDPWLGGSSYEEFMGRWSRQLAPRFVDWHRLPPGSHWLDVGCGTGALTAAICERAKPGSVLGCDPARPFVEYASRHFEDERATFMTAGVGALPARDGGYDCISSMFALNFFPDPVEAVREMAGLVRREGTVSACVWDYAGKMEFLRSFWDAVVSTDAGARDQDEGIRFPVCKPEALVELFRSAALVDVVCEPIVIETMFHGFDDYWRPFLGGTGPAGTYVASLDEKQRGELARALSGALPRSKNGNIELVARAWAVRGTSR